MVPKPPLVPPKLKFDGALKVLVVVVVAVEPNPVAAGVPKIEVDPKAGV